MPATDILHLATLQLRIILKCPVGKPFQTRKGGREGWMTQPWLGTCFVQWWSAPGFKLGKACGSFHRYGSVISKWSPPTSNLPTWSSYPIGLYPETKETCHSKQTGSPKITWEKNAWWQYGFAVPCSHSFAVRKKSEVSHKMEFTKGKIERIKGFPST